MSDFWGGFGSNFTGNFWKGQANQREWAQDKRAQDEHDIVMDKAATEKADDEALRTAGKQSRYAYTGPSFEGMQGYDNYAAATDAGVQSADIGKNATVMAKGMAARRPAAMPTPATAVAPPASAPAAAPPAAARTVMPEQSGQRIPVPMQAVDPDKALTAPQAAPVAAPPTALPVAPPRGTLASTAGDKTPGPAGIPLPAGAPTAAPAAGKPPAADEKMVPVMDPITHRWYRVPASQTRERTPTEQARDMYPAYVAQGKADVGAKLISDAATAQLNELNFNKAQATTNLSKAAIAGPASYAPALNNEFKNMGLDLTASVVMVDAGGGKQAPVLQFNRNGTDAPPFYMDRLGNFSTSPDPTAFNANVVVLNGMIGGDPAAALTSVIHAEAEVLGIAGQKQAQQFAAEEHPYQMEALRVAPQQALANLEATRVNTEQSKATTESIKWASTDYGAPAPGSNGDAYNTVFGNGKYGSPPKPLTDMTLGEVQGYQKNSLIPATRGKVGAGPNKGTGAVGAYQITWDTLQKYGRKVFGANWQSVPFTPENQERLAESIYNDSRNGNLHEVWQGLPNNKPGEYKDVPWSVARERITSVESKPLNGPPLGSPRQVRQAAAVQQQADAAVTSTLAAQDIQPGDPGYDEAYATAYNGWLQRNPAAAQIMSLGTPRADAPKPAGATPPPTAAQIIPTRRTALPTSGPFAPSQAMSPNRR